MIRREPTFSMELAYLEKANIVEIRIQIGGLPPFALGLDPEKFFTLCDGVTGKVLPFIDELKEYLKTGDKEAIDPKLRPTFKADINFDKLLELKKKWEEEHNA